MSTTARVMGSARTVLGDVFAIRTLDEALREGWVTRREHPSDPLAILNYTPKAVYDRAWNPCTLASRGLIYRLDSGEVVARPFPKFFNYGEPCAPTLDLHAPALVTDKLDGSLGILYPTAEDYALATRGSFTSEQAEHATEVWRDRYAWAFDPPPGLTLLFEVIYPENRIVIDYGGLDDLVLLGAIEIATGDYFDPQHSVFNGWSGPRADVFGYDTLAEALAAEPRPNAEGLVVFQSATNERVKLKQDDYVALHRIITGLNERAVWELLRDGGSLDDLLRDLPEEFHGWVEGVSHRIRNEVQVLVGTVEAEYAEIIASLPPDHTRKDFALRAVASEHRSCLFAKLDGKDYLPLLWDRAKPEPVPPQGHWASSSGEVKHAPDAYHGEGA